MTDPRMDPLIYGGGHAVPVMGPNGVEDFFFAPDVVLSNEFAMEILAPSTLADNQDKPACVITFKGVDAKGGTVKAVTVIMDPDGFKALVRMARHKYTEIPLEYR